MNKYKVSFFRLTKEQDEKGKSTVTGKEFLGSVTLDDSGVDENTSLIALAYRRATPVMQLADRTETVRL